MSSGIRQALSVVQRLHPTLLASAQRFSVALNAMAIPVDEVRLLHSRGFSNLPHFSVVFASVNGRESAICIPAVHGFPPFPKGWDVDIESCRFTEGMCSDCAICRDLSSTKDACRGESDGSWRKIMLGI